MSYESGFKTTLAIKLNAADTTMTVATAPTITAGRIFLDNGAQQEWIQFTGVAGKVITGLTRGLSTTADPATAGTGKTWIAGTQLKIVAMHDQLLDKALPQTINADWTFTEDVNVIGANARLDLSGAKKGFTVPNMTTAERLALTPEAGELVYDTTLGLFYQYKAGAWASIDTGSSTGNATDSTAGSVQLSKPAVGSDVGSTGAPLAVMPSELIAIYDSTYPAGEAITAGQCVFVESGPLTAAATTKQNISDITANTRISFPVIGTGVAGTTFKANLCKTGSPAVDLNFRIETDNAGSPSGTLVDANATAAVTAASLTTSLADTTVTLSGSTTLTQGTKYHIVAFQGTYGSETVSATNYYNIGYSTNHTSIRGLSGYNGVVWGATVGNGITDSLGFNLNTTGSQTAPLGERIYTKKEIYIDYITKKSTANPTTAYIKSAAGATLATATFVGNIASFGGYKLDALTNYRIECDSGGSAYTAAYDAGLSYPVNGTNINYIRPSNNGADGSSGYGYNIVSITTTSALSSSFPYISSTLVQDKLLSLTDSDYSYKADLYGISTETKSIGQFPKLTTQGVNINQTNLVYGYPYYLSQTPGGLDAAANGSYPCLVGVAIDTTKIKLNKKRKNVPITVGASVFQWNNTTGGTVQVLIYGGTVSAVTNQGISIASATGVVTTVCASGSVAVTYSSAPTMVYTEL